MEVALMNICPQDAYGTHTPVGSQDWVQTLRAALLLLLSGLLSIQDDVRPTHVVRFLGYLNPNHPKLQELAATGHENLTMKAVSALLISLAKSADAYSLAPINYSLFFGASRETLALFEAMPDALQITPVGFAALGVNKFIRHSDCDGYWTPGDAMDISFSFQTLMTMENPVFRALLDNVELLRGLAEQQDIFRDAAHRGTLVVVG